MAALKLADEIAARRETALVIEGDGHTFTIDPPDLWSDEKTSALRTAFLSDDLVAMATAIIGEDEYAAWVEQGGSANLLLDIYKKWKGELGESSASSSS